MSIRLSLTRASASLALCALSAARAALAEDAAPDPATAASSAQPKDDLKPARRVAMVSELAFCFDIPADDPRRSACLMAAADTLAAGLRYQACLWNMAPSGACASPGEAPAEPARAGKLLSDGQALVLELQRFAAAPGDPAPLRARIDALRAAAARLIRHQRGSYSLVSQGGVSLGSWQAGYVYYLTEVLKLKRNSGSGAVETAFKTVAGASAGAINALAAGIEGCRAGATAPEKSLFYEVWVDSLGLFRKGKRGLFPTDATESDDASDDENRELGLFDTAPLDEAMDHAERHLRDVAGTACAFNFGFSVTHLRNVKEPIALDRGRPTIQASKLTEYFALRVTPQRGAAPLVTNLPVPSGSKPIAALLGRTDAEASPLLLDAVRASGAFPVAFPPVHLRYRYYDAANDRWPAAEADFVDGGTLDNTPISLASTINDRTRAAPPNPWLTDLASPETYFFVNPGVVDWTTKQEPRAQGEDQEKPDLISTYLGFAEEFVVSGSDAQLVNAARQLDFLGASSGGTAMPQLEVPERTLPIAGAEFGHFMAFLEKDFRRFDFYVGVHDAAVHLGKIEGLKDASAQVAARLNRVVEGRPGLPELACLSAHHASVEGRPFTVIARKDLPEPCRRAPKNFQAMLVGMHNYEQWMTTAYVEEEAFDKFFEVLADARFKFSDVKALGSPAVFTENPRLAFRRLITQAIDRLASKQGGLLPKFAIKTAGRLAADVSLTRAFPRSVLGVGYALNGIEVPAAVTLAAAPWGALRLSGRLRFFRIGERFVETRQQNLAFVPSAFAGVTGVVGVPWLAPPGVVDAELSLGGTYSMLVLPGSSLGALALHSVGPSIGGDLVLLQRVYLHFDWEGIRNPAFTRWGARYVGTLLQQHQSDTRMNASIGWRFLFD